MNKPVLEVGYLEIIRVEKDAIFVVNSEKNELKIPNSMLKDYSLKKGDIMLASVTYNAETLIVVKVVVEKVNRNVSNLSKTTLMHFFRKK